MNGPLGRLKLLIDAAHAELLAVGAVQNEPEAAADPQDHNDKDVDAYGEVLAKKSGDTDTWTLAAVFLLLVLLPQVKVLLRAAAETPPSAFRLPLFFRPPLRAPPL